VTASRHQPTAQETFAISRLQGRGLEVLDLPGLLRHGWREEILLFITGEGLPAEADKDRPSPFVAPSRFFAEGPKGATSS